MPATAVPRLKPPVSVRRPLQPTFPGGLMTFPRIISGLLIVTALAWPDRSAAQVTGTRVRIVPGVAEDGAATELWLAMLRKRLPQERYEEVAGVRRPVTGPEAAWAALVRSRLAAFESAMPGLARLFHPVTPPGEVRIVIGNRGAEDAFTHDPTTIGLDLAALQANYGDADRPENGERIARFLRHEYVHLMQKAWWPAHPWDVETPLGAALAEIWAEGLGNYQSLSDRWLSRGGMRSDATTRALAELEPRLLARLAALACAAPGEGARLTADLSWGRFDRKWGALTAALWLSESPGSPDSVLRQFIVAGPGGVWDLAERQLPEPLRTVLREVRLADSLCHPG